MYDYDVIFAFVYTFICGSSSALDPIGLSELPFLSE